jgi:hypothetical protein
MFRLEDRVPPVTRSNSLSTPNRISSTGQVRAKLYCVDCCSANNTPMAIKTTGPLIARISEQLLPFIGGLLTHAQPRDEQVESDSDE